MSKLLRFGLEVVDTNANAGWRFPLRYWLGFNFGSLHSKQLPKWLLLVKKTGLTLQEKGKKGNLSARSSYFDRVQCGRWNSA